MCNDRSSPLHIKYVVMEKELTDVDLVEQIRAGDQAAEAELFRRMAPRVRLYGLRHLRDRHAADDLVQQVLLTALEVLRAGRLRESGKLASFVLGTCRMTVLDLKRNAQRKERLLEQFGVDVFAPTDSPAPRDGSGPALALRAKAQRTGTRGDRHVVLR